MSIFVSLIIVILLTVCSEVMGIQIIELPNDVSVHFGLTTICSIFAGFLYTNYSMLLDFSETEIAKKLSNTDVLKKRSKHIISGIISSICSIISGLLMSITYSRELIEKLGEKILWVECMLYYIEIVFIFTTVILFICSLIEMKQIIDKKIKPNNVLKDDTMGKVKKQMKDVQ